MKIKVKSKLIFLAIACLVIAVVLMILPYGVVMRWSAPPGETARITYCSYFDFTPYAYGHLFPAITAISTTISTVFILLHIFVNKFRFATLILTLIAAVCSISDILFWAILLSHDFSVINVIVPILLATAVALQIVRIFHKKK